MPSQTTIHRRPRWLKIICGIGILGLFLLCGGLAMITFWPNVVAQNIDRLRDVIGDAAVAQLETAVLNIQDSIQQFEYQVGLVKPAAPWADSHPDLATEPPTAQGNSAVVAVEPTQLEPTDTLSDTLTVPANSPTDIFTPLPATPGNSSAPLPMSTFSATYTTALCSIGVSDSPIYATRHVTFTANVNRDGRDGTPHGK